MEIPDNKPTVPNVGLSSAAPTLPRSAKTAVARSSQTSAIHSNPLIDKIDISVEQPKNVSRDQPVSRLSTTASKPDNKPTKSRTETFLRSARVAAARSSNNSDIHQNPLNDNVYVTDVQPHKVLNDRDDCIFTSLSQMERLSCREEKSLQPIKSKLEKKVSKPDNKLTTPPVSSKFPRSPMTAAAGISNFSDIHANPLNDDVAESLHANPLNDDVAKCGEQLQKVLSDDNDRDMTSWPQMECGHSSYYRKSEEFDYFPDTAAYHYSQTPAKLLNDFLWMVCNWPHTYYKEAPKFLKALQLCDSLKTELSSFASLLFETFLTTHSEWTFFGAQLCDLFSKGSGHFVDFRKCILGIAQVKFENVDHLMATAVEADMVKVRKFTFFMAELYFAMKIESGPQKLRHLRVLGRGMIELVDKILSVSVSNENLKCVIKTLRVSGSGFSLLRSHFALDDVYRRKLDEISGKITELNKNAPSLNSDTKRSLNYFVKDWLTSSTETSPTRNYSRHVSPGNYWYTPESLSYTVPNKMHEELEACDKYLPQNDFTEEEVLVIESEIDFNFMDNYDIELEEFLSSHK